MIQERIYVNYVKLKTRPLIVKEENTMNDQTTAISAKEFEVTKDCFCEGYLHELFNYPRELKEKKLKKGVVVTFVKEWSNLYGRYYRVRSFGGDTFDILPENLKEYTA